MMVLNYLFYYLKLVILMVDVLDINGEINELNPTGSVDTPNLSGALLPTGLDGKDGVSITNVEIIDNHLIVYLSDGTEIDAGIVSGGGGTSNYNDLINQPQVNSVTLLGNKSLSDLGIQPKIDSNNKLPYSNISDTPTIPTKLSDLANDNYTVKDANYVHTDNNYTTLEKTKLSSLENYDDTQIKTDINNKVDKVSGKGLSTNDYTTEEKNKLAGLFNYNDTSITNRVSDIESKIPAQATAQNQLADKDFVNSSIATATSTFRGTFNSLADLQAYTGAKDDNDYAFVIDIDSAGNTLYKRYKYTNNTWTFEYTLNNSSFTAVQWASINSGVSASDKSIYDGYATSKQDKIDSTHKLDYSLIDNQPTIPVKTSDLNNDSGFITSSYHDSSKQDVIDSTHKLPYSNISGTPTIPVLEWGNIGGTLSSQTDLINALSGLASDISGLETAFGQALNGKESKGKVTIGGTEYELRTGTSGASGYITIVLES